MEESLKPFLLLSDAVIITDKNHRILDVNKAYEDITGYDREQILGFRAGILKTKLTSKSTYQDMYDALNQQLSWSGIFVNKKKSGELWHSSISITPFLINEDCYYVGVFRELEHLQDGIYIAEGRRSNIQAALLKVLAISCEIRDPAIEEHLTRVQQLTGQLVNAHNERLELGLSQDYVQSIVHASIMHDIGKSGVPEGILYKPGPLTSYERIIIEMHPLIGVDILEKVNAELDDDFFKEEFNIAKNIILSHHEKWDGSGYPHCLKESEIPLEARIVSVVDVYDALTSRRPYKEIWDRQKSLDFIREHRGTFFDPSIIDTFVQIV
ncbi:HD domain-containing protein [Paenibacillus sp. LMG 31456]|uniref:HD domain-containing protein n=1 Tax=Paenibacillus foliorum TaxID=2654974 RepID=A0A972GU89_9BACL|nr:HD domain-containing phosphohydrolase [Paenibacillus foliorum]NOU96979.1 HD domain-containing protein [Paenibacillus foliorum]